MTRTFATPKLFITRINNQTKQKIVLNINQERKLIIPAKSAIDRTIQVPLHYSHEVLLHIYKTHGNDVTFSTPILNQKLYELDFIRTERASKVNTTTTLSGSGYAPDASAQFAFYVQKKNGNEDLPVGTTNDEYRVKIDFIEDNLGNVITATKKLDVDLTFK